MTAVPAGLSRKPSVTPFSLWTSRPGRSADPATRTSLVRWRSADGSQSTAIIEAKARSSGHVTHTDVSDVAIETHKGRHHASFIAIVGPGFSGDTIKNMAS
uniref:hypothetical protein n=1 Tax=Micromonospora acroterricola TaxID=2202421 RepID=UPI0011B499B2|nr:hypothetical protein [Micromonospora acroterricola]